MKIRILLLLLVSALICCNSDEPDSAASTELPNYDAEEYSVNSIDATSNFEWDLGSYLSPDQGALNNELFEANFFFLDPNFDRTGEEITNVTYSIFDRSMNVIIDNKILTQLEFPILLWDVTLDAAPYYGDFSYEITIESNSNSANLSGKAFSVSCELIGKCCDEMLSNCFFMNSDEGKWNSEQITDAPFNVINFTSACCN